MPDRCLALGGKEHCGKGESETRPSGDDRKSLRPLPAKRFDVVRWERMKTDKYGRAVLGDRHRYSTDPGCAGREAVVVPRGHGSPGSWTPGARGSPCIRARMATRNQQREPVPPVSGR